MLNNELKEKYCLLRDKIIENKYVNLNSMQRRAVLAGDGPILILAGAGSGKTTVMVNRISRLIQFGNVYNSDYTPEDLTLEDIRVMEDMVQNSQNDPLDDRIKYLLEEKGVYPGSILAITFTNKAAKEMKERVMSLIGERASDIWISTFHSACVRILRRDIEKIGYSRNFVIYDDSDQKSIIKDCIKELEYNEKYFDVKSVKSHIGNLKDKLKKPEEYEKEVRGKYRDEQMAKLYKLYQQKLKQNNALDFDDIINMTVELFTLRPDILDYYQRKFKYIMVDEYQDTNYAQYMFVKLLSKKHRNICVVGDDDQSIYGWRGADIRNILDFEKDFENALTIKLEQNYRSTQVILDAANKVIGNNHSRKPKNLWTSKESGNKIRIYKAVDERDEAQFICRTIAQLRENGYKNSDFAILYRMNAQSRVLEEALMQYAIPYRIYGGLRFYDRKEIKDIVSYLRLIVNPNDDVSLKRAINEPKRGIGQTTVANLEQTAIRHGDSMFGIILDAEKYRDDLSRATGKLKEFGSLMSNLIAMSQVMPVTEFIENLIEQIGYMDYIQKSKDEKGESRIENIKEFVSAASEFEKENPDAQLIDFLENIALVSDLDNLGEDDAAITLMTLHSAKGLEFPVVFMTGLEDGIFPSSRAIYEDGRLEEERRLCYVGITRAQKLLYISYALNRTLYGTFQSCIPSRFIDELPDDCIMFTLPGSKNEKKEERVVSKQVSKKAVAPEIPQQNHIKQRFSLGDRVMHKRFGQGTVVSVQKRNDDDTELAIAFEQGGIRKFLASLAPLKKID